MSDENWRDRSVTSRTEGGGESAYLAIAEVSTLTPGRAIVRSDLRVEGDVLLAGRILGNEVLAGLIQQLITGSSDSLAITHGVVRVTKEIGFFNRDEALADARKLVRFTLEILEGRAG